MFDINFFLASAVSDVPSAFPIFVSCRLFVLLCGRLLTIYYLFDFIIFSEYTSTFVFKFFFMLYFFLFVFEASWLTCKLQATWQGNSRSATGIDYNTILQAQLTLHSSTLNKLNLRKIYKLI